MSTSDVVNETPIPATMNGDCRPEARVSPEMLYKLSKKIAQLTKVIYSLNTRNDDLVLDMENMRASYEDKLQQAHEEIQKHLLGQVPLSEQNGTVSNNSHHPETENKVTLESVRKDLKKAKATIKTLENKMLSQEEEHRSVIDKLKLDASSRIDLAAEAKDKNLLEQQAKQLTQERVDMTRKMDRIEIYNENLKMERETLQKEIEDLTKRNSSLNLDLSAARVQLSYENGGGKKENDTDEEFTEELITKLESLTVDKNNLVSTLEESRILQAQQRQQIEDQKSIHADLQARILSDQSRIEDLNRELLKKEVEKNDIDPSKIAETATKELRTQYETTLKDSKDFYEKELSALGDKVTEFESLITELREEGSRQSAIIKSRDEETESLRSEIEQLKAEAETVLQRVKESTLAECQERICAMEKRAADAEKNTEDIQLETSKRIEELEANLSEMTATGGELKNKLRDFEDLKNSKERELEEKIRQLEEALEQALTEREEILDAAGKEIQNEKNIAIETEQKLMDDFEWKLREIECDHRNKMTELERGIESRIKEANDAYTRAKDEGFTQMSINLHRDLEEKMRIERNSLRSALESKNSKETETLVDNLKSSYEKEKRKLEGSWNEERSKLQREIRILNRKNTEDVSRAKDSLRVEYEQKHFEERKNFSKYQDKCQNDMEELKERLTGELMRAKAEYQERIDDLESRLRASDGHRIDSIFSVREDVESEYSEKMEDLRDMYLKEVEKETLKTEEERKKLKSLEEKLRIVSDEKRREIEELNSYYSYKEEEYDTKINELLTRLQEQTALAVKLKEEIDEYDWFIEDDEGNLTERPPNERPSSQKSLSRPPSAKPADKVLHSGGSQYSISRAAAETPPIEDNPCIIEEPPSISIDPASERQSEEEEEEEAPPKPLPRQRLESNDGETSRYRRTLVEEPPQPNTDQDTREDASSPSKNPEERKHGVANFLNGIFHSEEGSASEIPPSSSPLLAAKHSCVKDRSVVPCVCLSSPSYIRIVFELTRAPDSNTRIASYKTLIPELLNLPKIKV